MNASKITIVRVYLHEKETPLTPLLTYLHDKCRVAGVTIFRGVTGFGSSGRFHSSTLLDLSMDLPIVIEFFDDPSKVEPIIEYLNTIVKPGHIVHWTGYTNKES